MTSATLIKYTRDDPRARHDPRPLDPHARIRRLCRQAGADVETYIQIYNAAGFLMQVEADWVMRIIRKAKKPVMTIKPLAAGRLLPVVGLAFVWNTIRDQDMVTIGAPRRMRRANRSTSRSICSTVVFRKTNCRGQEARIRWNNNTGASRAEAYGVYGPQSEDERQES